MQQYFALTVHSIRLLRESVFFKRFYTTWVNSDEYTTVPVRPELGDKQTKFGRKPTLPSECRILGVERKKLGGAQSVANSQQRTVRPEGAEHQWRKEPPRELSVDLVADERGGRVTGRLEAS